MRLQSCYLRSGLNKPHMNHSPTSNTCPARTSALACNVRRSPITGSPLLVCWGCGLWHGPSWILETVCGTRDARHGCGVAAHALCPLAASSLRAAFGRSGRGRHRAGGACEVGAGGWTGLDWTEASQSGCWLLPVNHSSPIARRCGCDITACRPRILA
jgi:hypothetical protein